MNLLGQGRRFMKGRCWLLWVLLAACALSAGCAAAPKQPPKSPSDWIALPRPQ